MRRHRLAIGALAAAIVLGVASALVYAQSGGGEAELEVDQEVASYASDQGISLTESAYRMDLMRSAEDFIEPIRAAYPSRFAEAGFEHGPEFKIVIHFYGQEDGEVAAARNKAKTTGAPIEIRAGVVHSEEKLAFALNEAIKELPRGSVGGFYTMRAGTVSLFVQPEFDLGDLSALETKLTAKYKIQFTVQPATSPHSGSPFSHAWVEGSS